MVFIGSRCVVKTPARGRFHCPHCEAARAYAYRRVHRMLVVMYLPIRKRSAERDFVQCGFCRRAFHPTVLEREPPVLGHESGRDVMTDDWHFAELTREPASTLLTWSSEDDD